MLESLTSWIADLPTAGRVVAIIVLALVGHLLARGVQHLGDRFLNPHRVSSGQIRSYPRLATVATLVVSTFTFAVYFGAVGLLLQEAGISLETYVASATVIGLAVGFGLQGLVQDVVTGLTLIFSDTLNVGEMVDLSGNTGRVDRIGLRFTTLINLLDQQVHIPNRNIIQIGRYRNGYVRAYLDVTISDKTDADAVLAAVKPVAEGMHAAFPAIVLTEPEFMGVQKTGEGGWNYLRIKFRLWPGQGPLIEGGFRDRVLARLKQLDPDYALWMMTVTYRSQ
ncbi:MAG: mechanosensitive ion channel family protein [Rhodothermales bacterium]|nr:mechanosensitive ion channel family protein [Rhodothermales bacterium]